MDRKILWPRKGEVLKKQTFIEKPITQTIKATYQDLTYKYRWSLLPTDTVNENERGSSFRFYIIVFKRR
jgi:signal recognition particle subunit SEC65